MTYRDPVTGRFAVAPQAPARFGEPSGNASGEGIPGGWGESEIVSGELGDFAPHGPLGGGHFIRIDPAQWAALLHAPVVVDAITARAQTICDWSNDNVAMDPRAVKRLGGEGEAYIVTVQNRSGTTRARARVKPGNMLGLIDEAHNSTLLKSMNFFPSDPIPNNIGPSLEEVQPPGNTGPEDGASEAFRWGEAIEDLL